MKPRRDIAQEAYDLILEAPEITDDVRRQFLRLTRRWTGPNRCFTFFVAMNLRHEQRAERA